MRGERIGSIDIRYHDNVQIIGTLYPNREPVDVGTNDFRLSLSEPMTGFSSACSIVVIHGSDDRWSMYHGAVPARNDKYRTMDTDRTVEEFLKAWKQLGIEAQAVFIFGGGFSDDESEVIEFREEVVRLVKESTGIPDSRLLVKWNNHFEGETDVIVDPDTKTINVNLDYWE